MIVNLAGFAALGAMLLTLFAWLRHDNRALRTEMRTEFKELRAEMNARFEKQSEEMSARFGKQGDEIGNLRERAARIEGLLQADILRRERSAAPEPPQPEAA